MDSSGYFGGSTYPQKPTKSRRKLMIIVGGVVLVLFVAVLGIVSAGSANSPKAYSKQFLNNVGKKDLEKSYSMFSDELAAKTSKKVFEKSLEGYSKLAVSAVYSDEKLLDKGLTQIRYTSAYGALAYDLSVDVSETDKGRFISAYTVTQQLTDLPETSKAETKKTESK